MRTLLLGLIAGAAGKVALDAATYLDMLVRGRPASEVPARAAGRISTATAETGEDLIEAAPASVEEALAPARERFGAIADQGADKELGPRSSATGAMAGMVIGLGLGAAYAILRPRFAALPGWTTILTGAGLGAAAMAASDVPAVMTGATSHPREWTTTAWLSDIVPHAVYGFVTTTTFEAIRPERSTRIEELAAALRR